MRTTPSGKADGLAAEGGAAPTPATAAAAAWWRGGVERRNLWALLGAAAAGLVVAWLGGRAVGALLCAAGLG